jgi:hypothetical protein
LAALKFPKELMQYPKLWNKTMGPLVLASEYDRGDHFATWERPDAIVKDLREMFGKDGGLLGVSKAAVGMISRKKNDTKETITVANLMLLSPK